MTTSPPPLPRTYTVEEERAFTKVSPVEWGQTYTRHRGPAWYGSGPGWPAHLRREALRMEKLVAAYRVAADALEREGCHD